MAVGHQDHGRVAMPVAAVLARAVHQPLDLALGEVTPLDCQVYDAWCAFLGCRFHAGKPCLRALLYRLYAGGTGAGASMAARAARPTSFLSCHRTSMWGPPPVGGTFWFQIFIDGEIAPLYSDGGRPGIATQFVIGLFLLKHIYGLSDEGVCERWVYDPYFQHFTGEEFFQHEFPHERSDLSHWRKRLGGKLELLLAESLRVAHESGALR